MENIYLVVVSDQWHTYSSMQIVSMQFNKKIIEENYDERVKINEANRLDDVVSMFQVKSYHDYNSDLLRQAEKIKSSDNC